MNAELIKVFSLVAALLAFAVNQTGLFPAGWYNYINLASGIVGVVVAWLKDPSKTLTGAPKV